MKQFKALKNLVHDSGELSFTKSQTYSAVNKYTEELTTQTMLRNNQGLPHIVGIWKKYFKVI